MAFCVEDTFILSLLFDAELKESFTNNIKKHITAFGTNLNWEYIIHNAFHEGVSELLYHNINKYVLQEYIPKDVYQILKKNYYTNLKRNMRIISELKGVLNSFNERAIPCIVLKGIALAEHVYPSIAARGMTDIDIMVHKSDLYAIDHILSYSGYTCRDSSVSQAIKNPEGYLASIEYQSDNGSPLNLHIHWHTVNSSVPTTMFVKQVDIEQIWAKSLPARVADADARILCPEHLVIYLCEHALRIGHSFDRLILICDIFYAIKTNEKLINWDTVAEESRRFNLDRFVFFSLSIVKFYSSLNIPEKCMMGLKPGKISPGEKFFQHLQFGNHRIRGSSYCIYLAMNQTVWDKTQFLARTFFPPPQILLQRQYIKNREGKNIYYIFRIWEVFSHIFKMFLRHNVKNGKNALTSANFSLK